MLDFLDRPIAGGFLELGIVGEDVAEIGGIVAAIELDQRRRLGNR